MSFVRVPEEVIIGNILKQLNKASILSLSQTSHFFNSITKPDELKVKYINKIQTKIFEQSNEMTLEKIEEHIDFLAKHSGKLNSASYLLTAIHNNEEKIKSVSTYRQGDIHQMWTSPDPDGVEKEYESLQERLTNLNALYRKKFGFLGLLYQLIDTIEYKNKLSLKNTLTLLHLIKQNLLAQENVIEIIEQINTYSKTFADFFVENPDQKNNYIFLGKSDVLISLDSTTNEIQILGQPIDAIITQVSQALPNELINEAIRDVIKQCQFMCIPYNPSEISIDALKEMPEFEEKVRETKLEAEATAIQLMAELNASRENKISFTV